MAVVDADIIVYGSANMQETNSGTQGGAIDTAVLMVFTDISPNGTVDAHSTSASDTTQTVTVYGRIADGTLTSENLGTLTGTTPITGSTVFERILKVVMSATAVGVVVVEENSGGEDLVTLAIGTTECRRPFYDVAAEASGGSAVDYYEKIFFYNSNATSALTSATIAEIAGGAAAQIDFMLPATLDDSGTSPDRITAPAGTFDSATKNVANSQSHSPVSGQGVWIHLSLPAGTAANNTTYTLRESGQTV